MNLIEFNLKELSANELQETNGGLCTSGFLGVCLCGVAAAVSKAVDDFAAGFKEGFNQGAADGSKA